MLVGTHTHTHPRTHTTTTYTHADKLEQTWKVTKPNKLVYITTVNLSHSHLSECWAVMNKTIIILCLWPPGLPHNYVFPHRIYTPQVIFSYTYQDHEKNALFKLIFSGKIQWHWLPRRLKQQFEIYQCIEKLWISQFSGDNTGAAVLQYMYCKEESDPDPAFLKS